MNFQHDEERRMLADTVERYLSDRYGMEARLEAARSAIGYSPLHWSALSEMGVIGALFSEEAGGFGGTGFDIAVLFEQFGRFLLVEPFLAVLIAGRVMGRELPEDLLSGRRMLTCAHQEPGSYRLDRVSATARRAADGWRLDGRKAVVPHLGAAAGILVPAMTASGLSLFLVEPHAVGVTVEDYALIDGGRAGDLRLDAAPGRLVGLEGKALPVLEEAVAAGIVALCWEAVGIMDVIKASTIDYMRTRTQFGVPIGSFQALQHRMATVALDIEQARSAAIRAAASLQDPRLDRERAVSAAKFTIGRTGLTVAEEAIQIHGGIGMTMELPLSHYAKRLMMIGHQLGDEDHHLERFIDLGRLA
ncbi:MULTISPECIES: acyl-CoA dehydrogenase family protein [Sphingobium]|uniref:acyl-CoA dehydrogenase family protein n=1 Tax=Sphingobium TaxID=165695 RepID=UPI00159C6A6C|nr:acyl-CoA dehydrogenase [Sphingobium sp. 15-1]